MLAPINDGIVCSSSYEQSLVSFASRITIESNVGNNMTRSSTTSTALELSHAYRSKEISPVEVTRAVLARIETCEPKLNAMYIIDAKGALVQAAASETRWRESRSASQLDGVPITIKDLIATMGDPAPIGTAAANSPRRRRSASGCRVREAVASYSEKLHAGFGMLASGVSSLHRYHAQSVEHRPQHKRIQLGRRCGDRGRLWPLALGTISEARALPAAYTEYSRETSLADPDLPAVSGSGHRPMTRTLPTQRYS